MPAAKTARLACAQGGGAGWQSFCRLVIYGSSLLHSPSTNFSYIFLRSPLLRAQDEPTEIRTEVPTWNCSMLCGGLDGRGVWREWIHMYVWLSPFALHRKLSQHCQPASLQYKNLKVSQKKSYRYKGSHYCCSRHCSCSQHLGMHPLCIPSVWTWK